MSVGKSEPMIQRQRKTYQAVGEGTSKQRTSDGCNAIHATNKTNVRGSLCKRDTVSQDEKCASKYAGGTKPSNRSPDNQSGRIWSSTADQATELKNTNCGQEYPFSTPEFVELAKEKL